MHITLGTAVVALMLASATVEAAERVCRSAIGAVAVDDVRVPRGATCTLNGTLVRGSVKVETNATLVANSVVVIDDIQADGASNVSVLADSRIGGSVAVKRGGGASVEDSRVGNNVQYDRNKAAVSLLRSHVDGNVDARRNTGGVSIANNTIAGNLQCADNNPVPTGSGNIVGGNKEGQCAGL
jgi:hypothetical protein